jgi:AAA ATPase domain
MDPVTNPFAPGAGTPPPELAGRDGLREAVRIAIERQRRGNPAKSLLLVGLRGVGKTVLLDRMRLDAERTGALCIKVEASEKRSLPGLLAPKLRSALLVLSRTEKAKALAQRALRGLAGFARALKVKFQDIEMALDFEPELGLADNGDLERDLSDLLAEVGAAAQAADTVLVLFMDELQYVPEEQFAAFIHALHGCAQQKLPVCVVGAGLPQLRGRAGEAKSYAERLFDYPEVGQLPDEAARQALVKPVRALGVEFEAAAVDEILRQTSGYPYFLQEWGKRAWEVAVSSPIGAHAIEIATQEAIAALDESFFRVRFDRLTPVEKRYMRAMAELGPGPHRSGDVADVLGRKVTALSPVRSSLIGKGMIWSPGHGDTAFTVPLFDAFMKRIMPGSDWKQ